MKREIGPEFIRLTKYEHMGPSDQERGVPSPTVVFAPPKDARPVVLPSPEKLGLQPVDLFALISARSSLRTYADTPLSLEELSFLLWCTQGVKETHGNVATLRTVPSAGARHAFETVLLINRVDTLAPGFYGYDALHHKLFVLDIRPGLDQMMAGACLGQLCVARCAVVFTWVAIVQRMTWRYGQRGYRYLHLDAGHVCQNLYLASEAIGCGACAIGAYDDDALDALLPITGEGRFAVYVATVGTRA